MEELDCFNCGNVSKVVHSCYITWFGDIVSIFCYICDQIHFYGIFTQFSISILQNPHTLMLQITTIKQIDTIIDVFTLELYPHGTIFWVAIKNIFPCHKMWMHMAWKYSKNICWCTMEYVPKIFSCSLEPIHPSIVHWLIAHLLMSLYNVFIIFFH